MKAFSQNITLGIVGGGQLGRMLIEPCLNFGVSTRVLDPDPEAPCSQPAGSFHVGSLQDYDTVLEFGRQCDLVTIEIENINVQALYQLEQEGIPVYPQASAIEIIQDKRVQKQFYLDNDIPTADFVLVENREDARQHTSFLPAFNKMGKGGYDGGGVQKIENLEDLDKVYDTPGLLEKFVVFEREISIIAARSVSGEISVFPVVECIFHEERNLVDYLLAPADLSAYVREQAEEIAVKLMKKMGLVGILAVECFVTKEGDVLVNEIAPRPHNSGHQSREANITSQYEQLLRAILDLPLGSTATLSPSAMLNLLGEDGHTGPAKIEGLEDVLAMRGASVTLYGKKNTRPFRKMGHITMLASDRDELNSMVREARNKIRIIT